MAVPTTPPTPPTQPTITASESAFTRMFVRLGLQTSSDFDSNINKSLTAMQSKIKAFNDSTQFKDSFFAKMPGISGMFQKLLPDVARGTQAMILFGQASKSGEDNKEFYNNLSLIGKLLVNITPHFNEAAEGASALRNGLAKFANTTGIVAIGLITAAVAGLTWAFKFSIGAAIEYQTELNKFNILMGGVARDRINKFNTELNDTIKATAALGLGLSNVFSVVTGYIKGGLNPHIALQKELVSVTGQLAVISGDSAESMASFFSKIMVGSKITTENLNSLGNSFVSINRMAEKSGLLASVSFTDVKEAISSVGTALLLASNRGSMFTDTMAKDLVSLTTLSKTLGVSVSEINGKFEEASNLLNSPDSGFRAILAISGGANVSDMLSNSFNKTDAMLKVASTLERLNAGLGGNLNLMGQIAQQSFGISKEAAIKYATMTQEQKHAIIDAQRSAEKMRTDGVTDAYNSVTGTLEVTWDKFKNVMMMSFQRAFAGNSGIQNFLGNMTDKLNSWVSGFGDPNSPAQQFVDKLAATFSKIADGLSWLFDNLVPIMDRIGNWLNSIISSTKDKTLMDSISHAFGQVLLDGISFAFHSTIGNKMFWWSIGGSIVGGIAGGLLSGGAGIIPGMSFGAKAGAGIGAYLGVKEITKANNDQSTDTSKTISTMMGPAIKSLVAGINHELSAVKREENRLHGIKDTDVVVGKDGKFTLAGMERIALEEREEKLLDLQEVANKTREDNTGQMKLLTDQLTILNASPEKRELLKQGGALPATKTESLNQNANNLASGNLPPTDAWNAGYQH